MIKYKLLCTDLDGTLLTEKKKIKRQDVDALRKAAKEGAMIALVTNRMPAATEPVEKMLGISCIWACNGGTCIMEAGKNIHAEYIPVETMHGIWESIKMLGISLWLYRDEQWFVTVRNEAVEIEEKVIGCKAETVPVETLLSKWERERKGANELIFVDTSELVKKAYNLIKECQDIDVIPSSPGYMEVLPKGVNKGTAVRVICKKKGIGREETIAFGDHRMDIPMLEAAGVGIAMGNAINELKMKADFITKTNEEAGIAWALQCIDREAGH